MWSTSATDGEETLYTTETRCFSPARNEKEARLYIHSKASLLAS